MCNNVVSAFSSFVLLRYAKRIFLMIFDEGECMPRPTINAGKCYKECSTSKKQQRLQRHLVVLIMFLRRHSLKSKYLSYTFMIERGARPNTLSDMPEHILCSCINYLSNLQWVWRRGRVCASHSPRFHFLISSSNI